MKNKRFRVFKSLLGLGVMIGVIVALLVNVQTIRDDIRLYNYDPPSAVAQLATDTTMTSDARRVFYVNHPQVDDRAAFNQNCSNDSEDSIILGCYHSVDQGIFVFQVTDTRLTGVDQVTAAHEMLHAAYDRLSTKERDHIDSLLLNFYKTGVTDQRIKDTIAGYQKTEPNDVVNEMHSIFPTEIATLPAELETYYRTYFTDRSKVAQYANQYQQEFTSRSTQVDAYDAQLAALKISIDTNTATLKSENAAINTMQSQMAADRSAGNIAKYNTAVPIFNARIESYNALVRSTQTMITNYNQIVNTRNSLALEVKGLAQSIDSRPSQIDQ